MRHHRDRPSLPHSFPTRRSSDRVGATTLQQMRAQRPGPQSRKIDDAWRVAHWRRGLVQGSSAYQLQPVGLRVRAGAARRERESEFATAQKQFIDLRRSEEHTSELQSLMRISYAVFCLKKK